jgi:peptide/nickel transport system ATP-binding protein
VILMITHTVVVIAQIADAAGVMYSGALVEISETRETFRVPKHPYTWSLIETLPRLHALRGQMLPQIRRAPPSLLQLDRHCSFLPRCPKAPTDGGYPRVVACFNPVDRPVAS